MLLEERKGGEEGSEEDKRWRRGGPREVRWWAGRTGGGKARLARREEVE